MIRIVLLVLISVSQYAQNLDSLYSMLINSRINSKSEFSAPQTHNGVGEKCGFGMLATIKEHYHEFNKNQQNTIAEAMARPELSSSIVSPSGYFRIHFDETGSNQPEYNINDLAAAFDSAYNFEINILGYPEPPSDGDLGGDDKYDVYVLNLGGGLYGATTPESATGEGKFTSYIEMDNSFGKNEGYNSFGINAARVTAAHEFHHSIQLGSYIFRSEDTYYHELTSTAFEEFVFDEVNDYYAYMSSYFRNTRNKLENNSGYNLAAWNIFLHERFSSDEDPLLGHRIIKKSWENINKIDTRAILAVKSAIESETSFSFTQIFNEFGSWLYFTDYRAKENAFFEEAENYPLIRSNYTLDLDNTKTISFSSEPTSINYITFYDYPAVFADTIVAVISNSDASGSLINNNAQTIEFTLSNSAILGGISINDVYFYKLESETANQIQASYVINNELSDVAIKRTAIDFVYPQPFSYGLEDFISIPVHADPTEQADLSVFTSDMDLVYSGTQSIVTSGNTVVRWDGFGNNGEKLSSGIYIYVTKANGKIKKGKFVIFH